MDKNDAKTLIKINRDVEKFLDYPYLYPPVLSAMIVGNCSEMETWLHFYFYFYFEALNSDSLTLPATR